MTSPGCRPAAAAAPSGSTSRMTTPSRAAGELELPRHLGRQRLDGHPEALRVRVARRCAPRAARSGILRIECRLAASRLRPSRRTSTATFVPGLACRRSGCAARCCPRASRRRCATITSPCCSPARAAALPGSTLLTSAPPTSASLRLDAMSAVTFWTVTPSRPRTDLAVGLQLVHHLAAPCSTEWRSRGRCCRRSASGSAS